MMMVQGYFLNKNEIYITNFFYCNMADILKYGRIKKKRSFSYLHDNHNTIGSF